MKRLIKIFAVASLLSISVASTAMAGTWKQEDTGWRWQDDDHTYPSSTWKWIDSDSDGMAECYYFDGDGTLLTDTITPDGYTVDQSGAWTDDGITRQRATNPSAALHMKEMGVKLYQEADKNSSSLSGLDMNADVAMALSYDWLQIPIIINMQMKYHDLNTPDMEFLSSSNIQTLGINKVQSSFYTNGFYYSDSGENEKFKMKIGYEDMKNNVTLGGLTGQFSAFFDDVEVAQDKDGNQVLFYFSNPSGLESYLSTFYDEVWPALTESDFQITNISGKAVITPEGYFSKEEILISMMMTEEDESMVLDMGVNLEYNNPGQAVTIEFPSTEGYEELVY